MNEVFLMKNLGEWRISEDVEKEALSNKEKGRGLNMMPQRIRDILIKRLSSLRL